MKKILLLFFVAIFVLGGIWYGQTQKKNNSLSSNSNSSPSQSSTQNSTSPTMIAENLDTPWALSLLPDNTILVTERSGDVRIVSVEGGRDSKPIATIKNVVEQGEGGLMGAAIHPDFSSNNYVYFYYTYNNNTQDTLNRVVRMTYRDNKLTDEKIIVDQIPGASNHNGGRIKFGPDKYLYITTGDAQNPSQAQDIKALSGKILRVTDEGKAAPGNPFNNLVYSYGHRNPQGIAWDAQGDLWSTEHGPSGFETGNDEVNKIEIGKNYGWPVIRGMQSRAGMEKPVIESGTQKTWAPASAAFMGDKLFFTGLRGAALYEFDPTSGTLKEHFTEEFGRIREVIDGPDGVLYITTSNKDGRGDPKNTDDRILRINL